MITASSRHYRCFVVALFVAIAGCDGSSPAVSPDDGSPHLGERSDLETTVHDKKARLEIQCAIDVKRLLKAINLF
jgi:hypothetical protein